MFEVGVLIYFKIIDAYTEKNFRKIIAMLIAVTAVVLIANFSRYKKARLRGQALAFQGCDRRPFHQS